MMADKPFPHLDGREERTKRLRRNAYDLLGGQKAYNEAGYIQKTMACRAVMLEYMMETSEMSAGEYTQASNALMGILNRLPQESEASQ